MATPGEPEVLPNIDPITLPPIIGNTAIYLLGLAKLYPVIFPMSSLFYGLLAEDTIGLFLAGYSFLGDTFNQLLKLLFHSYWIGINRPENSILLRPRNPGLNNICSLFETCQPMQDPDRIGMPSGHVQLASMAYFLLSNLFLAKKDMSEQVRGIGIAAFFFITAFVMFSRWYIGCHTWIQVYLGFVIGYILGVIGYYLIKWFKPETWEDQSSNSLWAVHGIYIGLIILGAGLTFFYLMTKTLIP